MGFGTLREQIKGILHIGVVYNSIDNTMECRVQAVSFKALSISNFAQLVDIFACNGLCQARAAAAPT